MQQPPSHQPSVRYVQSVLVRPFKGKIALLISLLSFTPISVNMSATGAVTTCVGSSIQLSAQDAPLQQSHDSHMQRILAREDYVYTTLHSCDHIFGATVQQSQKLLAHRSLSYMQGGKLSVLAAAVDPRVVALCLLDPVDNTVWAPLGPGYPSAIQALKQLGSKQVLCHPSLPLQSLLPRLQPPLLTLSGDLYLPKTYMPLAPTASVRAACMPTSIPLVCGFAHITKLISSNATATS